MNFFKFGWLNSTERAELQELRKQKELSELEKEKAKLEGKAELLEDFSKELNKIVVEQNKKPYKSRRLIGDQVIVLLHDGTPLTGGKEIYDAVGEAKTEEEIIELFTVREVKPEVKQFEIETKEERQLIRNNWEVLENHSDFIVKGDEVYLKGVGLALPAIVCSSFIEILEKKDSDIVINPLDDKESYSLEEQYEALKAFTYKLFLNPLEISRQSLLKFVKENEIKITSSGNFVGFRRIVQVSDSNKELIEFISSQYIKIKKWKKSCKSYKIIKYTIENSVSYSIAKIDEEDGLGENLGTLEELYLKLPELDENRYTDDYSRSYDIRIGSTYKIREEDMDLIHFRKSCGGALHLSDGKNFCYSSFGNTPVCCIVSPQHVVKMDTGVNGKIGVRQMFIAAITKQNEDGTYVDIDDQDLVNFDEIYHNETIAELEDAIKNKSFEVLEAKDNISPVSIIDLKEITFQLQKRIVSI